jgi:hypothetical protein
VLRFAEYRVAFVSDRPARITLTAPAEPGSLQVLRAIAGSIASRLDLSIEVVEEIRIAVDEAGTLLLKLGGDELCLEVDAHGPDFAAVLSVDADTEAWPDAVVEDSWPWRVIAGLCDEARFERSMGHPGIMLRRGMVRAPKR